MRQGPPYVRRRFPGADRGTRCYGSRRQPAMARSIREIPAASSRFIPAGASSPPPPPSTISA
jgi:hypothetical protein